MNGVCEMCNRVLLLVVVVEAYADSEGMVQCRSMLVCHECNAKVKTTRELFDWQDCRSGMF